MIITQNAMRINSLKMFIPLIIFLLAITNNTLTIVFLATKHTVPEYVFLHIATVTTRSKHEDVV